jgi:hypothetical protein
MDISSKINLPPVAKTHLRSEADFYGASSIIAEELGMKKVPRSFATWRHGWIFTPLKYVSQLIWMDHDAPFHLVATEKEASFLTSQKVRNVVAVGTPFIYADLNDVERIPKSLLVMPPQNFENSSSGMDEQGFIEYIKTIAGNFSTVVFCLHQVSVQKGNWCANLERAGFDWVFGASPRDKNSLLRMHKLFHTFEYMTTCSMGSQLVYGAYCGCKVSISGDFIEYKLKDFETHPYYKQYPELLHHNFECYRENFARQRYPFLFTDPRDATVLIDWAHEETGASCRKSAEELRKYLGWDFSGQVKLWLHLLKKAPKKLTDMPGIVSRRFARRETR